MISIATYTPVGVDRVVPVRAPDYPSPNAGITSLPSDDDVNLFASVRGVMQ